MHHNARTLLVAAALLLAACGPAATPSITVPEQSGLATPRPRPSGVTPVATPIAAADPRGMGDPSAPITVVEFADFQCPFCASFVRETKPQLVQEYVETGKVYLIYRDLPLLSIHPGALMASHIASCAGDQGAFWPMHARIFGGLERSEWGGGDAADFRTFLGYARELGLDAAALQECVESNRYAERIQADMRAASDAGIRSTPSFLINGRLLVGAQPYEVWQRTLDELLAGQ